MKRLIIFIITIGALLLGGIAGYYFPQLQSLLMSEINTWDNTAKSTWNEAFSVVRIPSNADGSEQSAYFYSAAAGTPRPLVVSLHTWSGGYTQKDPLAEMVRQADWNYIHPDFRGPNRTPDACLSPKAMADIDDAIQYAIDHGNVDPDNICVVGASGGGYATLGTYLKTTHKVKAFLAWASISDVLAWYHESVQRNARYARDILQSTSDGVTFDPGKARKRSPLYWDMPAQPNGRLEIYAGIHDGYTGSVPIAHSIQYFNRLVEHFGFAESVVGHDDMVKLLTRGIEKKDNPDTIGGRDVLFRRDTDPVSLIIFDGGHEMLTEYCFERLKQLAE